MCSKDIKITTKEKSGKRFMANEKSLLKEYILQSFVQKDNAVVDILDSSTNKDVYVIKISQCGTNTYITNGLSLNPMNVKNKSLQYVEFVVRSTNKISMETEKNLVEILVNSLQLKDNSFLHEFHTFSLDYLRNGNKENIEYDTFLCLRAANNFYYFGKRISFMCWLPIYKEEAIWVLQHGVFAGSDRSEFYIRATSEFINKYKGTILPLLLKGNTIADIATLCKLSTYTVVKFKRIYNKSNSL